MPKSIAVAGKGGTGKSTIAALIILALLEKKMGAGPLWGGLVLYNAFPGAELCAAHRRDL